jgi:hypothetical protein
MSYQIIGPAHEKIAGIIYRDGVPHFLNSRSEEVTRDELRALLTPEQWAQVEAEIESRKAVSL